MVIYKTINLVNGKQYIGRDSNNNPNYYGSGPGIIDAIKKYGKENFKKEIIEVCSSHEELIKREEYWLNYYDAGSNRMFYNMNNNAFGSGKGKNSPMFGRKLSDETRKRISDTKKGDKNHFYGKKLSDEHRKKLSQALGGEKNPMYGKRGKDSPTFGLKPHFGKKHSEEVKKKISESLKGRVSPNKGKPLSDETKKKLSDSFSGEKNPSFKGYIICTEGKYKGQVKLMKEWASILGKWPANISSHINGIWYKNGIDGNFFKWAQ